MKPTLGGGGEGDGGGDSWGGFRLRRGRSRRRDLRGFGGEEAGDGLLLWLPHVEASEREREVRTREAAKVYIQIERERER